MKRVLVIGSCGAGKSTFARSLHAATGLPLVHLDRHYWKPDWVETPKEEWKSIVEGLISEDEWIIDGNYGGTMELRLQRADTVIWIDMPRFRCAYRVLKRTFLPKSDSRPDMAEGCDERLDIEFLKYVWNFPRDKNPLLQSRLSSVIGTTNQYRLTSSYEIGEFLSGLTPSIGKSSVSKIDANSEAGIYN